VVAVRNVTGIEKKKFGFIPNQIKIEVNDGSKVKMNPHFLKIKGNERIKVKWIKMDQKGWKKQIGLNKFFLPDDLGFLDKKRKRLQVTQEDLESYYGFLFYFFLNFFFIFLEISFIFFYFISLESFLGGKKQTIVFRIHPTPKHTRLHHLFNQKELKMMIVNLNT